MTKRKIDWVPISERMPKLGECIIVTIINHMTKRRELRYPVCYRESYYAPGYNFYWKDDYTLRPDTYEVIAWMPMPNPYKEVEKYD